MAALLVSKPGMLTTVQDLGRWGYQQSGVPVAGPMDAYSHRLANRLVGNPDAAATLEVTVVGPDLVFEDGATFAVAGAEFPLTLDGAAVRPHAACDAGPSSALRFGMRQRGARAYLAVAGGFDVAPVLGSRATSLVSGMGPFGGRVLRAGDRLPIGAPQRGADPRAEEPLPLVLPTGGAEIRVIWGPQADAFTDEARYLLTTARYEVTPQSNRMGYRLAGPGLSHVESADILSEATPIGSLQVPASGQPILLMAGRQTTGGYPKIATVITADLPIAGQLAPGDWIAFAPCTRDEARRALVALEERLGDIGP
jgi:antagonist of KipI